MKKIVYILLALLLVSVGFNVWLKLNPKIQYVPVPQNRTITYTTPSGNTVATTTVIREKEITKVVHSDSLKKKLDNLIPDVQRRTQKIQELTEIKAKLEGELLAKDAEISELKSNIQTWKGKYMQIAYNKDSNSVKYSYNADIKIVATKKDKHGNATEISVTSPDPNFKVDGIETFRQEIFIPKKKFGIGVQGGYYYSPEMNRAFPAIGVGVSYNLIRF
ncbi:hypothetical protein SAMN05443429_11218 [Cruoricaptor ignavus]|uniref:Uncharacterized protein n=1 Tax=Cruoricaptor ignavus TaxID=1118202 RepID=A0A1M6HD11_9FLAO|nr:hypothetical protein [Cruoricaptor ignavus]SHJ20051.1 hypothetical protein SAMN05443429_11218 [Cruoricaptor ignavus]